MTAAAEFDHRATFLRMTVGQDAAGIEVRTPVPIATAWAKVSYGTSSERRTAAGTEAGQALTVRVKRTAKIKTVLVSDQIELRNPVTGFTVTAALQSPPIPARGGELEFTAMAPLGAGA